MAYFELHARSAFSFLRGASAPESLALTASTLALPGATLLDRDGVYGAPRFYGACRETGLRARVGAEITMEDGTVVPLIVASRTGYQNLCQLITESKLTPRAPHLAFPHLPPHADPLERKRPCFATWAELARFSEGLIALTGDEEGPVRQAWRTAGPTAAEEIARAAQEAK
jgi:error-prone DNA polymerase